MGDTATQLDFFKGESFQHQRFAELFSYAGLNEAFYARFSTSTGKGTDRINGFQFGQRAEQELAVAAKKCVSGDYYFAPYLESLKPKGRDKFPRLIAIPTIRDRVVLKQLNAFSP